MTSEQEDTLALFGVPGIGAKTFARLAGRFESPAAVFDASDGELLAMDGIGPVLVRNLRSFDRHAFVAGQKRLMEKCGAHLLIRTSEQYPALLNLFSSAPPVLFVRGDVDALSRQAIAFVGTRAPSEYGVTMTHRLVAGAVSAGLCIVSGMAAGIDAAAHHAALDSGGKTVAVFGSGADIVYPAQNRKLSDDIIRNGCVVSHFPMGTTPLRGNFPARNAVIVGLSLGTVVVEAPEKSGALITADLTMRAGRKLFAVPGNATSRTSQGTNTLLTKGAYAVLGIEQVLTVLGKPVPPSTAAVFPALPRRERPLPPGVGGDILKALEAKALHVDDLSGCLGIPVSKLLNELTMLELDGYVRQNPGKIFEKC